MASLRVSTQAPEQGTSPEVHWNAQLPALQLAAAPVGAEQTLPHLQQLDASESRSTHEPEHLVFEPQSVLHLLDLHTCPLPQAFSQLPQCSWLDVRSRHVPLQAMSPALQTTPHFPAWQVGAPFSTPAHTCPQVPQFCASVSSRTQTPLHEP